MNTSISIPILVISIFILLIFLFGPAFSEFVKTPSVDVYSSEDQNILSASVLFSSDVEEDTAVLTFVGDIMLDRGIEAVVNKYGNKDYSYIFERIENLNKSSLLFGNLEGPISDKGKNAGSIYSFRMEKDVARVLKNVGFDVLSVANNHIGDWGKVAFTDTLNRLSAEGIISVGDSQTKYGDNALKIKRVSGIRIGFLAFSDKGPNWLNFGDAPFIQLASNNFRLAQIKEAKKRVDILVVSYHFGEEYEQTPNKRQKEIAQTSIDSGADIIIGHHPHVIQEVVKYNGGVIAYSLGNFVFDQYFSEETMKGLLLEIEVTKNSIKSIRQGTIQLNNQYQPAIVSVCGYISKC